ncbi:uncharacterized protein [Miscanthus floridulus]|uniref:uncharacterized protein n=1 Tax=Miscanthus floridulus TaxID=154761 RepID=UPI0034581A5D
MMFRASASSPAFLGGGGEDALGPAIARLGAEADALEARALGKHAVSPVGSSVEVEQAAAGATQPPPWRVEGALESSEGRSALAAMEAMPPPLKRTRDAIRKRQVEVPALAPCKVLKGEATEAAAEQVGDEVPTSLEAKARESDRAEAPSVAEATKGEAEAPKTSEAKATEARASGTTEAEVAEAGAPGTTEVEAAEAAVGTAEPATQEAETEVGQASVLPLVQGPPPSQESAREVEVHSISSDDASRGKEVADAEEAGTVEQLALTSGKGSSALMWVQPEPHGWDHPCVLWRSRDDPKGEPLFALEDTAEGGRWSSFEQYRRLAERSLRTMLSVMADDLPGVAQELEARSLKKSLFLQRERDV